MKILRDPQILSGYLVEKPFRSIPAVTHCGEALCVRGHNLPDHRHEVFEILVMTRGKASWIVAGKEINQAVGEVLVTYPRQMHRTGKRPNPENQHLWIGLDLDRIHQRGRRLARNLRRRRLQVFPVGAELEALIRGLLAQAVHPRSAAASVGRCYVDTIIAVLEQSLAVAGSPSSPAILPCSLPIQRCLAYMGEHLDRRIPLSELARIAAIRSLAHFCTRFRQETGNTPAETHLRLRLDAARETLHHSESSVTHVAAHFGFSSSQHFSMSFKRAFGLSPRQWKNTRVPSGLRSPGDS